VPVENPCGVNVVRVRQLAAVVAVIVAASTLTACTSKVGVAATVDGHRITESELGRYVTPAGPSPSVVADV
jgi:hypothetical protein